MMWTRENFRTGMSGRDTVSGQGIFAKKEMLVRTVGKHPWIFSVFAMKPIVAGREICFHAFQFF